MGGSFSCIDPVHQEKLHAMTKQSLKRSAKIIVLCGVMLFHALPAYVETTPLLQLERTIPLPDVAGRIDHLSVDAINQRLFIAALGNNTLEIIDLRLGKRIASIGGFREPQGVYYEPEHNKIYVANGGDGIVTTLDGTTYRIHKTIKFSDDADNIRYDPVQKRIYVGYGSGALGIVDAANETLIGDIQFNGHPESFQLEEGGTRIFINIPTRNRITVVDRNSRKIVADWPLEKAGANYPMTIDQTDHRLFIGSRKPPKILVYDTRTGRKISEVNIPGDTDDIFFDPERRHIYASCGQGFLAVIQSTTPGHYSITENIPTAAGARTSLFVHALGRLYLAVPRRAGHDAEIRIYTIQP